ncbi:MAG: hypothetical protein JSW12_14575, partial [Deltaproteobacteria bacterium]
NWFRVKVPNYVGKKDSYLRLGKDPGDENETTIIDPEKLPYQPEAGWFDYTDGVHTSISGPTVSSTEPDIYDKLEDPIATRAVPPNFDDDLSGLTDTDYYDIREKPHSPYDEYKPEPDNPDALPDAGFWRPSPGKTEIEDVINKKNTRYYPYWDEKTSKRQQYDADPSRRTWKYSYDVKKDDLVRGSHRERVQGDRITDIEGTWDCTIKGHLYNTAWGHVHSDYYQSHSESYYGDVLDVYGQPDADVTVTEIAYGPKYEWHFGDKVEVVHTNGGTIYEYHKADKTEYVEGYMEEDHLGGKKTTIRKSVDGPEIVEKLFVDDDKKVEVDYGGWLWGDFMHTIESFHGSKEERYYGAHTSMDLGLNVGFFLGLLKLDVIAGVLLNNYLGFVHDFYGALRYENAIATVKNGACTCEKEGVHLHSSTLHVITP